MSINSSTPPDTPTARWYMFACVFDEEFAALLAVGNMISVTKYMYEYNIKHRNGRKWGFSNLKCWSNKVLELYI